MKYNFACNLVEKRNGKRKENEEEMLFFILLGYIFLDLAKDSLTQQLLLEP